MNKSKLFLLFLLSISAAACRQTADEVEAFNEESFKVTFKATSDRDWQTGDRIAVFATCTRNGIEGTRMSEAEPAMFAPVSEGKTTSLTGTSEVSDIIAEKGDHGFAFYAFYPYSEGIDIHAVPIHIPASQKFEPGGSIDVTRTAGVRKTSVIAQVEMKFRSFTTEIDLVVPADIIDSRTVLKSIVMRPAEGTSFDGALAYDADFDIPGDALGIDGKSRSREIAVDFGEDGYALPDGKTTVPVFTAPFEVPEGGFELVLETVSGKVLTLPMWADAGSKSYAAGDRVEYPVTREGLVENPCTSPVEWPVGWKNGSEAYPVKFLDNWNKDNQPVSIARIEETPRVLKSSQPSATMSFIPGPEHRNEWKVYFEINSNKALNYSGPCVKGLWTGDCFEFCVPVEKIDAGTEVTLSLPAYQRGAPVFWNVEYYDGKQWKCDKTAQTIGEFTEECTWVIPHGNTAGNFFGRKMAHTFRLTEELKNSQLKIRMTVADGSVVHNTQNAAITKVEKVTKPNEHGLMAFTNNMEDPLESIRIEW